MNKNNQMSLKYISDLELGQRVIVDGKSNITYRVMRDEKGLFLQSTTGQFDHFLPVDEAQLHRLKIIENGTFR